MIIDIEIKQTPDKGRGVFAMKSIPKGTKHISEGIVLKSDQLDKTSPIWMYVFSAYDQSDIVLVLDWTSLMNDSKDPNIMYYTNENNQVVFEVIKDINPGDELLIDYGYDVEQHTKDLGIDLSNWNNKTINKRSMKQFVFDPVTKEFSDKSNKHHCAVKYDFPSGVEWKIENMTANEYKELNRKGKRGPVSKIIDLD